MSRPLAVAYIEAMRKLSQAEARLNIPVDDELFVVLDAEYEAADAAAGQAERAWLASDEEREYAFGGDSYFGHDGGGHWHRPSEVEAALREWARGGSWDNDRTIWVRDYAWAIDPWDGINLKDYDASVTTAIDPPGPKCSGGAHDWRAPFKVLGGLKENPGVWGSGGGVKIRRVCANCGRYWVMDTWAQNPMTGEQGLTSVEYEEPDEASLEWVRGLSR